MIEKKKKILILLLIRDSLSDALESVSPSSNQITLYGTLIESSYVFYNKHVLLFFSDN